MKVEYDSNALKQFGSIKDAISKEANSPLQIMLTQIATQIVSRLKTSLRESGADSEGALGQSIAPTIIENDTSIGIQITAEEYWDFVNSGVNGLQNSFGSQYSFKTPYPNKKMAQSLQGWIGSKGIGNANNFVSLSYAMATKLKVKGIEPNHFVDKVLTAEFIQEISLTLSQEIGKEVIFSINENKL